MAEVFAIKTVSRAGLYIAKVMSSFKKKLILPILELSEVCACHKRLEDAAVNVAAVQAMSDVWGRGEHVQCIHPAAGCIAGRENVSTALVDGAL